MFHHDLLPSRCADTFGPFEIQNSILGFKKSLHRNGNLLGPNPLALLQIPVRNSTDKQLDLPIGEPKKLRSILHPAGNEDLLELVELLLSRLSRGVAIDPVTDFSINQEPRIALRPREKTAGNLPPPTSILLTKDRCVED